MPTTIATSQNGKTMKSPILQSEKSPPGDAPPQSHHRRTWTGVWQVDQRYARVAGKPGDHRTLIVAAIESTTVRQITASVSIHREPEHTRDQEPQGCFIFRRL